MRYWPHFVALMAVALLAAPLPAQSNAIVKHVTVRGTGDAIEVEIQTSGSPVAPNTQAITGPDRIVVDFPGAIPAAELKALKVNGRVLKGVRSGLFFNNPPITRIVLDLAEAQSYHITTNQNTIIVKLGSADIAHEPAANAAPSAQIRTASLASGASAPAAHIAPATMSGTAMPHANIAIAKALPSNQDDADADDEQQQTEAAAVPVPAPEPPKPVVNVSYDNGMLRIHAERATLAQVLFEVHQRTQAEIAIPAGAEQEQVVADFGPAPARDVLGALLNGSSYNFVFVGDELSLQKVILTRRDPNAF
jgi:AMIN domain